MANDSFKRVEMKYRLNSEQRAALEALLQKHMVPDAHGESTICNIYYDTPDFRLIRKSIEKPVYKEKLRLRSYGRVSPDDKVFLELKKKYKGVVYKRRISLKEKNAMAFLNGEKVLKTDHEDFKKNQISKEIMFFVRSYPFLRPAIYLCYDRTAYFSKDDPSLRMTFDRNIRYRTEDFSLTSEPGGEQLLAPGESILEIKASDGLPLWLVDALDENEIRKNAFSKVGSAYQVLLQQQAL